MDALHPRLPSVRGRALSSEESTHGESHHRTRRNPRNPDWPATSSQAGLCFTVIDDAIVFQVIPCWEAELGCPFLLSQKAAWLGPCAGLAVHRKGLLSTKPVTRF